MREWGRSEGVEVQKEDQPCSVLGAVSGQERTGGRGTTPPSKRGVLGSC